MGGWAGAVEGRLAASRARSERVTLRRAEFMVLLVRLTIVNRRSAPRLHDSSYQIPPSSADRWLSKRQRGNHGTGIGRKEGRKEGMVVADVWTSVCRGVGGLRVDSDIHQFAKNAYYPKVRDRNSYAFALISV